MSTDATQKEPDAPRPQVKLPKIVDLQISLIQFQAPERRHFESYLAKYNKAIEFLVKTDGPFRSVALPPALYVGDAVVSESGAVNEKENLYRFLAFEPSELEEGAPITLGWLGQPAEQREETEFRYELPDYNQKEK